MNKISNNAITLNNTLQQLIDQVRMLDAPEAVMQQATEQLQQTSKLLAAHKSSGVPSSATLDGTDGYYKTDAASPQEVMPYSPIIGKLNPVSLGFIFEYVNDRVEGYGTFPATFTGPPNTAHGGIIAAVFDELLAAVVLGNGVGAFTGTLSVRYISRTHINKPVNLKAEITGQEGRKVFAKGEILQDGVLTATAEAIFIKA